MEEMTVQKLAIHLREHRKSHHGKEKHAELPVLFDQHAERAPSLLHHRINTCSASIAVTLANKATVAAKKKMNDVLRSCWQKWGFSEKKGQRDTRPSGNESRALPTSRGLLRELLCIRYGRATDPDADEALNEMNAAQEAVQHVQPVPGAEAAVAGKKRRLRSEVSFAGGSKSKRAAPVPAPPPPPPTAPPPQVAEGLVELDDEEDEYTEADAAEAGDGETADFLPAKGEEFNASDRKSASKVWLAVIELNEVLHMPSTTARARYERRWALAVKRKAALGRAQCARTAANPWTLTTCT
uniref:Uncharacterized protein n=1 Tax=Chrysotila carterae TaxID=13221 RepID=A0A7S4C3H8_CHRCT